MFIYNAFNLFTCRMKPGEIEIGKLILKNPINKKLFYIIAISTAKMLLIYLQAANHWKIITS